MRFISSVVVAAAVSSSASAGLLTSAMIDDFSGPSSAGLGFARTAGGGASVSGGAGLLSNGGYFSWMGADSGFNSYNASAFSGISLKVTGSLAGGRLEISILGSEYSSTLMNVDVTANVSSSTGYLWVTFAELDNAGWGAVDWTAVGVISLAYSGGTGSISIDDFEFRSSPVPAPGALALLGVAGLVGARRRR